MATTSPATRPPHNTTRTTSRPPYSLAAAPTTRAPATATIALNVWDSISLTGHISTTKADLTIAFGSLAVTPSKTLPPFSFKYRGTFWKDSAKLVTSGPAPATEGISKSLVDPVDIDKRKKADDKAKKARDNWPWSVIGICGFFAIVLESCSACGTAHVLDWARKEGFWTGKKTGVEDGSNVQPVYLQHQPPKRYQSGNGFEPYSQQGYQHEMQPVPPGYP